MSTSKNQPLTINDYSLPKNETVISLLRQHKSGNIENLPSGKLASFKARVTRYLNQFKAVPENLRDDTMTKMIAVLEHLAEKYGASGTTSSNVKTIDDYEKDFENYVNLDSRQKGAFKAVLRKQFNKVKDSQAHSEEAARYDALIKACFQHDNAESLDTLSNLLDEFSLD